jgi:hypothetical protein
MKFFKNFFTLFLTLIVLSSCKAGPYWMHWMYEGPPPSKDGKPYNQMYVDGWKDGCETGVSATTNSWYKFHHKFKQDPIKAQDNIYYKGWRDALTYCGRYIFIQEDKKGIF